MKKNSITIYSNGITAFTRNFQVKTNEITEINLPIRNKYISDVLGTLNVFGAVSLVSPPSFTPVNANKSSLNIDVNAVFDSLITQLAGTTVNLTTNDGKKTSGTLMGKQVNEQDAGTHKITYERLQVLTNEGIRNIDVENVKTLEFTESEIKSEIEKALQSKRESIKPNSTFVNLQLKPIDSESNATIQYVVPTAAWIINYRLNQNKGKFSLEAYAVVHNNTDEDWNDYIISLVVGEPLTFESDLNEQKTPTRTKVAFVKSHAEGGNTAEIGHKIKDRALGMAKSCFSESVLESVGEARQINALETAQKPLTNTTEIGDFTIWTNEEPITVKSQKSALVHLFNVELSQAKTVLYYKHDQNPTRPYRAVKFKNSTEWSLGNGPCAVYQDNINEGTCALEACKPSEERMLLHAKETGVQVMCEAKPAKNKTTNIRVSENIAITEIVYTSETTYTITNNKNEDFCLELDHKKNWEAGELKSSHPISEKLSDGSRLKVELKPKEQTLVTVTETLLQDSRSSFDTNWLRNTFPTTNELKGVFSLQDKLNEIVRNIQTATNKINILTTEQGRIRENLKAFASNSEESFEFRTRLKQSENEIKDLIDKTVPDLTAEKEKVQKELDDAKMKLTLTWKAE